MKLHESAAFVSGGISKSDINPVMTHVLIKDKRIHTTDGVVNIEAPFDVGFNACVVGGKFFTAMKTCKDAAKLKLTDKGSLSVSKKSFRSLLQTIGNIDSFPTQEPAGDWIPLNFDLIALVKRLRPFVSDDNQKMWARSLIIGDGYVYATNNVSVVRAEVDFEPPFTIGVPIRALDQIVKIGINPNAIRCDEQSVTFLFEEIDCFLRTTLYEDSFPDFALLMRGWIGEPNYKPIPPELAKAIKEVVPYVKTKDSPIVVFDEIGVHAGTSDDGASVQLPGLLKAKFHVKVITPVLTVATHIDLSKSPSPFCGDGIEGAAMGLNLGDSNV